ncbi:uncharacterized protein LOC112468934 [Temnothorax curvispinosus]|uniref:Uncharacterized protein LOC112468934 n=1 Tax=Temnothorax curvispinosus TaxID=300111 RepID=A0A6J1RNK8_9HYME|nr:uncharacterized protein LOC112468934 [Temnothorax curvispinosus]
MPTCCIKNCASRTDHTSTRGLKFFRFPKETDIRQQWLDACQRNETNIKIDTAHVCNLHFEEDCFQMEWTKPRSNNVPAKLMRRLKKGFIPTKLLLLQKKRKEITSEDGTVKKRVTNEKKKVKVPVKTDILINAELELCVHEEQINEEVDDHQSISMESLLDLLKKTEEEKKNLLADKNKLEQENQQIRKKNEKLTTEIEQLQLSVE